MQENNNYYCKRRRFVRKLLCKYLCLYRVHIITKKDKRNIIIVRMYVQQKIFSLFYRCTVKNFEGYP